MIDLNIGGQKEDQFFQEGILSDALKTTANVDVDEIKDDIKDSDGGPMDNLATINDKGLDKAAKELKRLDKAMGKNRVDNRSIIARARNSTLQFPVYVSQSCPVNAANTINKAWERVYTSYVQTVLSQNPIISEEEANNLLFMRRFHSNIKESAEEVVKQYEGLINEFYESIDDFDQIMQESIFHRVRLSDTCYVEFAAVPTENKYLIQENARLSNEPLTGFTYLQEADKGSTEVSSEHSGSPRALSDEDLRQMARDEVELTDAERHAMDTRLQDYVDTARNAAERTRLAQEYRNNRTSAMDKIDHAVDEIKEEIQKPRDQRDPKYRNFFYDGGRYMHTTNSVRNITKVNSGAPDAPILLRNTDLKKINNALPYTMEVTFRMRTAQGNYVDVRYIIQVKTIMHMIRAQDIAEDLQDLITGDMKNLRKIRYKTGEIGLMDYIFNLKGLKADAAKHISYNKRWLNTLKRLGEYEKLNGTMLRRPVEALTNGRVPIPNGTLVLTQPDITMITNQTGIDLSNAANAKKLAKRIFLFSIIIVDASAGTLRVLYPDESGEWDVQSLASIDAEVAKTDNSQLARELNRMINR